MSDDVWRRGRRGRDDDDDDFGPPLFGDDMTREMDDSDGLSFGDADTGPLSRAADGHIDCHGASLP